MTQSPVTSDSLQFRIEQLEQALAERNRQIEVYRIVQQAINRQLEVEKVLQMIADYARLLTGTAASTVYLLEGDRLRMAVVSGMMQTDVGVGFSIPADKTIAGMAIRDRKPYCVPDARSDPRVYKEAARHAAIRSFLVAPLFSGDTPLGVIWVTNKEHGVLDAEDERILSLLAENAVAGLENARLYAQAAEAAVLAERSRLARDLHDSVTQSLFSASLIGDVLPRLWEQNPQEGRRRLEELRHLTRGALAEMRTLLLELRPAALEETPINELMQHLANAFTGRASIPVQVLMNTPYPPPPTVKTALYRIAQEALNNINKYADAGNVLLRLDCLTGRVVLEVLDDGSGFDPTAIPEGHLGLPIMRERAAAIGADFELNSEPGAGTQIIVTWFPGKVQND